MADDTLKRGMFSKMAETLGNVFHRQPQRYYLDDFELQLLNISPDTVTTEERVISLDSDMYKKLQEAKARLEQKAGGGIVRLAKGGSDRTEEYERLMMILDTYGPESDEFKNEYQQFIVRFPEMGVVRKAQGGPMDTENVGIMDGVGIGADAILQQEKAIDSADSFDGVMTAVRGKEMNEAEARGELAEIVGPEDAQQTPDSVLALVQPVIEMAQGPGIAQFVEEAGVEEQGPMMAQAQQPMMPQQMMPQQMMPQTMAQGGPVKMQEGGMYRGQPIQTIEEAYQAQLPIAEDILGGTRDPSGLKSDILFQIARGGLEMARGRKPGESADPISVFAQSFSQPLENIGALARAERIENLKAEQGLKSAALTLAKEDIAMQRAGIDEDVAYQLKLKELEADEKERAEDLASDYTTFFSVADQMNVALSKADQLAYKDALGPAAFATNFLPKIEFKTGSYEVIDRDTGGKPSVAPTGRMDLHYNENDGMYYYRGEGNKLFKLPENITVSAAVSAQSQAGGTNIKASKSFEDAREAATQLITGVEDLDDIYKSALKEGAQLGTVSSVKKYLQNVASIAEDIGFNFNPTYQTLLEYVDPNEDAKVANDFKSKTYDSLEQSLYDTQQKQNRGETLSDDEKKHLEDAQQLRQFLRGNLAVVEDENGNLQLQRVERSAYLEEELYQNAVKINSIIYAVARARKPTGRLNVDDVKTAAAAIDIRSGGEQTVMAALRAVREELATAGRNKVKEYIQGSPGQAFYQEGMDRIGITKKSFDLYRDQYLNNLEQAQREERSVDISALPDIFDISAYGGNTDLQRQSEMVIENTNEALGDAGAQEAFNFYKLMQSGGQ